MTDPTTEEGQKVDGLIADLKAIAEKYNLPLPQVIKILEMVMEGK